MPFLRSSQTRSTGIAAGVLVLLLALLAGLQYLWIGEVSEADRERRQTALANDGARFTEEFDRELSRAFLAFQPVPGGGNRAPGSPPSPNRSIAERVAEREESLLLQEKHWRSLSPTPQLLHEIYVKEPGAVGETPLLRLDPAAGRFVAVPWPATFASLRQRLEDDRPGPTVDGEAAALILPLLRSFGGGRPPEENGHVILALDRRFIVGELLPELADRWFGASREPEVLLAVSGPAGFIYRSDPGVAGAHYLPGDLTLPMFSIRRIEGLRSLAPGPYTSGLNGRARMQPPGRHVHEGFADRRHFSGSGTWKLVVTYRAGSLEAAVSRARWKNLAVSFGVIALLAASLAVMAVSMQRARGLARQQLDLVAGITHELNTPLAAIRSAGQNLADGVVADGAQVRRYGALIEREGSRLSGMVAKALELAGIQSGHRAYRPEPVVVEDIVEETLADCHFLLEERKITVERDLPRNLPAVWADRGALRMAFGNLLDNAIKYAAAGGFIAVRAATERGGKQVSLTVEDHGPGIRA
ncbi:MAG TPA: histidine kinase dimerization/phospho-acceptor domain-containing protein, partial [Thermoanaerobaculia bacterium]|nr:histidine kinase dimerization/phospho-acceptor domain-containing protein [Thermoanaerobaculia bacterium]